METQILLQKAQFAEELIEYFKNTNSGEREKAYFALDGTIVLRNMNENVREYLKCPEFDDYILYKYEILK